MSRWMYENVCSPLSFVLKLLLASVATEAGTVGEDGSLKEAPFRGYHSKEHPSVRASYVRTHIQLQREKPELSERASIAVGYSDALRGLHGTDIWANQEELQTLWKMLGIDSADLASPSASPRFVTSLVHMLRPRFIVEVGVFLGYTTINLASALEQLFPEDPEPFVLAIDTWLGDAYHWSTKRNFACKDCTKPYFDLLRTRHGFPLLYYQFLRNVFETGMARRIVPFPLVSSEAARVLDFKAWRPDLVYIDASHDTPDVLADLEHFLFVFSCGGFMFGAAYPWEPVRLAVDAFSKQRNLTLSVFWVIGKGDAEQTVPYNGEWVWDGWANSKWVILRKECSS
eukprot:TRINITY_DN67644_c0_g1_i1.p1 TRINITY_DN67644_c0_g1~~TRINITY_DN67644_c0_g1_i1.p1  ORF type:complete len:342 (-),score=45.98 TRINITY_DN67644_c0_g1_i1:560-1585(-)